MKVLQYIDIMSKMVEYDTRVKMQDEDYLASYIESWRVLIWNDLQRCAKVWDDGSEQPILP